MSGALQTSLKLCSLSVNFDIFVRSSVIWTHRSNLFAIFLRLDSFTFWSFVHCCFAEGDAPDAFWSEVWNCRSRACLLFVGANWVVALAAARLANYHPPVWPCAWLIGIAQTHKETSRRMHDDPSCLRHIDARVCHKLSSILCATKHISPFFCFFAFARTNGHVELCWDNCLRVCGQLSGASSLDARLQRAKSRTYISGRCWLTIST